MKGDIAVGGRRHERSGHGHRRGRRAAPAAAERRRQRTRTARGGRHHQRGDERRAADGAPGALRSWNTKWRAWSSETDNDGMSRTPSRYDAIIIGGGHNGLVTACYLARAELEGARAGTPLPRRRRLRHRGEHLPRLQGLHGRLRQQPVPPGDHPRPALGDYGFERAGAQPVVVHAVPRRPLSAAGPRRRAEPRARSPSSARRTPRTIRSTRRCWSASPTSSSRR